MADLIGDRKRDTKITKLSVTSAFFGTRSIVRIASRFVGIPRPVAVLLASLFASVISELTKYLGRSQDGAKVKAALLSEEIISWSEIAGDVSKWVAYDECKEFIDTDFDALASNDAVFRNFRLNGDGLEAAVDLGIGALAAIVGSAVKDLSSKVKDGTSSLPLRYSQAALEGGILFSAYGIILKIVKATVPEKFNEELIFERVLESVIPTE